MKQNPKTKTSNSRPRVKSNSQITREHFFRLIFFNFTRLSRNWGTYLIPLCGLGFFTALTLPQLLIFQGGGSDGSAIFKIMPWTFGIVFFISVSFEVFLVYTLFSKTAGEGLSLVIIGKNIGRKTFISANMITLFLYSLVFSCELFIWSLIMTLSDHSSSGADKLAFSASIFIATMILMGIFGAVIVLFSLLINAMTLATIFLIGAIGLPGMDLIIRPMIYKSFPSVNAYSATVVTNEDINSPLNDQAGDVYNVDHTSVDPDTQGQSYKSYNQGKFSKFAWVDPWYQISSLYSIFYQSNNANIKKWEDEKVTFKVDPQKQFVKPIYNESHPNGQEFAFMQSTTYNSVFENYYNQMVAAFNNSPSDPNKNIALFKFLQNDIKKVRGWNFETQILFAEALLPQIIQDTTYIKTPEYLDFFNKSIFDNLQKLEANKSKDPDSLLGQFISSVDMYGLKTWNLLVKNNVLTYGSNNKSTIDGTDFFFKAHNKQSEYLIQDAYASRITLMQNGYQFKQFVAKDFIPVQYIAIMWSVITAVALSLTFFIYTRSKIF